MSSLSVARRAAVNGAVMEMLTSTTNSTRPGVSRLAGRSRSGIRRVLAAGTAPPARTYPPGAKRLAQTCSDTKSRNFHCYVDRGQRQTSRRNLRSGPDVQRGLQFGNVTCPKEECLAPSEDFA